MTTEDYCQTLSNLSPAKALQVILQARAQMDLNHDGSEFPFLDNRPATLALDECIALGEGGFNRIFAVRAIHQAFLQIAFANKHLETPPDNAATLASLGECMVDAGHIGFPIPA